MRRVTLIPIVGCWVKKENNDELGIVEEHQIVNGIKKCRVKWPKSHKHENIPAELLRSGFPIGIEVQDIPRSRTRTSLGEGVVVESRTLGGRDQVLVEFRVRGERFWLPFENLKQIKGVQSRFELQQTGENGNAERFRLRNLAYAIEMWHENTGALSHLNIDPLPHQIHLVHHILASGNLNWMIADDVGLGKTVEIGMLLSALLRRGTARRILLITPAGLVNQWKEELHHKFGLSDFQIYGEDFHITEERHWKMFNFVIGSIDRMKNEDYLQMLNRGEGWDVIVFDEAHRLSRVQYGMKYQSSERFRLAASLRRKTDSMILLTATPHQGKPDKFQALLELLRPELKEEIRLLPLHPHILRDMVIRNNKAHVTDVDGQFIFQGKITRTVQVPSSAEDKEFDQKLQQYLRKGYAAGSASGGFRGRAIGFVMATCRKLAASSIAAVQRSLVNRKARLMEYDEKKDTLYFSENMANADERFIGEWEEIEESRNHAGIFFEGEIELLDALIEKAGQIVQQDNKLNELLNKIVPQIANSKKILIFTEYRGTQDYLANALKNKFGNDSVSLLHGSMSRQEREEAIVYFEEDGRFLVSTEAGGEGINLQRRCHVMINYDLPWNPMRLVQRVGRLYRYGQREKVVVFNISMTHSIDGSILGVLYQRIEQVVKDMAAVGDEYRPGLEEEIIGELVDSIDVTDILDKAIDSTVQHTQEEIDKAVQNARAAVEKQRELLEYAFGYSSDAAESELNITLNHVEAFIKGMLAVLDIQIIEKSHDGRVIKILLPQELSSELNLGGQQLKITIDRGIASRRKDIHMMDMNSHLFQHMLNYVKQYEFDGRAAKLRGLSSAVLTAILRWQNDQGVRMRQEYFSLLAHENDRVETNGKIFAEWLRHPAMDGEKPLDRQAAKKYFDLFKTKINKRLAEVSNNDLHPENFQLIGAAYSDCSDAGLNRCQQDRGDSDQACV